MAVVLLIVGLCLVLVGVAVFLWPMREQPQAQGVVGDIGIVLEQVNKLLEKFDKRFRPGILVMFVGLVLVGVGAWLKASEAKNAADSAVLLLYSPALLRLRKL